MPDWSQGEDRYMAEYRRETQYDRDPNRIRDREYISLTDASCRPPCPNCDGPVVEDEGVLCDDCRAAEQRLQAEVALVLDALAVRLRGAK